MKRFWILVFFTGILSGWAWGAQPAASKEEKIYQEAIGLMEKQKFDEAIPRLEKAIALDKQYAAAYYALAVCQARKSKPDTAAARRYHKEAVALGYVYNEWLDTYCTQLDKKSSQNLTK